MADTRSKGTFKLFIRACTFNQPRDCRAHLPLFILITQQVKYAYQSYSARHNAQTRTLEMFIIVLQCQGQRPPQINQTSLNRGSALQKAHTIIYLII